MGSSVDRNKVLQKSGGFCWYCGTELTGKWHVDHVQPIRRQKRTKKTQDFGKVPEDIKALLADTMQYPDRHTIENMVPACVPCNLLKSVYSVEEFRREIERQADRARAYSVNFRTAERFNLIEVHNDPVLFWFEIKELGEAP